MAVPARLFPVPPANNPLQPVPEGIKTCFAAQVKRGFILLSLQQAFVDRIQPIEALKQQMMASLAELA
jgi:hypothetical protein